MSLTLGFEFEFLAPVPIPEFRDQLAAKGIDAAVTLPDRIEKYDRWWMVPDGSIRRMGSPLHPMELISPVFDETGGIRVLNEVLGLMELNGCQTNDSTGLHVGIGSDQIRNIDTLKLVLLLNEHRWLSAFDRTRNAYCKNLHVALDRNIRRGVVAGGKKIETLDDLRNCVVWNKYYSVNFTKLRRGYLEFRIIGGRDYHLKTGLINKAVRHFIDCVKSSMDVVSERGRFEHLAAKALVSQEWIKK